MTNDDTYTMYIRGVANPFTCGVCVCSDRRAALRASWNETLEEASESKILVKKTEEIEREVGLANKALVMVSHQLYK